MKKSKQWAEKEGLPTDKKSVTLKWKDADRMIEESGNACKSNSQVVGIIGDLSLPIAMIESIIISKETPLSVKYKINCNAGNLRFLNKTTLPVWLLIDTIFAKLCPEKFIKEICSKGTSGQITLRK